MGGAIPVKVPYSGLIGLWFAGYANCKGGQQQAAILLLSATAHQAQQELLVPQLVQLAPKSMPQSSLNPYM